MTYSQEIGRTLIETINELFVEEMDDYQSRKAARKAHYEKYVKGWKKVPCSACNGSGRYDDTGSPKCGACRGTGKERISPEQYVKHKMKTDFPRYKK
jgi:RecJ-like exonuclease